MAPTRKRFEREPYLSQFTATVVDCRPAPGGGWLAALDETAFFPEGGGQPCDTGTLGGAAVTAVEIDPGGTIWHRVEAALAPGSRVAGRLDWPARFDHMQQHTGEHILSGLLHQLYGCENVGFHIGEPTVRMDLSISLTPAQLARAEDAANEIIQQNLPVHCFYPSPAALAHTEYRSKKAVDGPLRLVEIPHADCCACCGTHLATTGEVRLVKIITAARYKGGMRLAVACGARAVRSFCAEHSDVLAAGALLSAPPGGLAGAAGRLLENGTALHGQCAALEAALCDALAAAALPGQPRFLVVNGLESGGLRRACLAVCHKSGAACGVFAPGGQGWYYALAPAGGGDIRPFCQALNGAFGGRGGGKPGFCQGSLPPATAEALQRFWADFWAEAAPTP
ncbi:MAG: alanyl-tRNA editing protein [Gemmiger sp.]|nr:alanyl-tRNA editing protein [Gemmiger sp.]